MLPVRTDDGRITKWPTASAVILLVVQLDQERKQFVRQILGRLILLAEHGADQPLNREVRRPLPRRGRLRFRAIVTVMKAHGSPPAASTVRRDNDISARIVPGTRKSNTDGAVPLRHLLSPG